MQRGTRLLLLGLLLGALTSGSPTPALALPTLKTWINRFLPGTFPIEEPRSETPVVEAPTPSIPAPAPQNNAPLTQTERRILTSLMERKQQLDVREGLLSQREEQLRLLQDNVQQQIGELRTLQDEIEQRIAERRSLDAQQLQQIVRLYEGMEPRLAADRMATLAPRVAVAILLEMNQRKASALLQALPAEQVKRITERIVDRGPVDRDPGEENPAEQRPQAP